MKNIIRLEEATLFLLSIYALYFLEADWWYYLVLLIGPDISMVGYLAGNKVGAIAYNLFHHKALAALLFLLGLVTHTWILQVSGIILFGHSSMDRVFGYGLKYFSGFKHTHLGVIGDNKLEK
jgi:hypothetical protein